MPPNIGSHITPWICSTQHDHRCLPWDPCTCFQCHHQAVHGLWGVLARHLDMRAGSEELIHWNMVTVYTRAELLHYQPPLSLSHCPTSTQSILNFLNTSVKPNIGPHLPQSVSCVELMEDNQNGPQGSAHHTESLYFPCCVMDTMPYLSLGSFEVLWDSTTILENVAHVGISTTGGCSIPAPTVR